MLQSHMLAGAVPTQATWEPQLGIVQYRSPRLLPEMNPFSESFAN
jgi:hypothetical protein